MSFDNDGEGGILALMSLLSVQRQRHRRPAIVVAGLLGAALIYGDGAITPTDYFRLPRERVVEIGRRILI